MKFKEKIYCDYNDVLSMCKNLEYEVSRMRPDLIVAIVRGGMLPALHLSHALDVPLDTMVWSTRDQNRCEFSEVAADYLKRGKTVVFVDDINDTGTTMRQISKECAKHNPDCLGGRAPRTAKFVAMTEKIDTKYITDARALRIDDPRWLVFPWEKD